MTRPEDTVDDMFAALPWFALPDVVEDAPHDVKEGAARRRHAALVWRCPCGGAIHAPTEPGRLPEPLAHAADCPGDLEQLDAAFDRWAQWLAGGRE